MLANIFQWCHLRWVIISKPYLPYLSSALPLVMGNMCLKNGYYWVVQLYPVQHLTELFIKGLCVLTTGDWKPWTAVIHYPLHQVLSKNTNPTNLTWSKRGSQHETCKPVLDHSLSNFADMDLGMDRILLMYWHLVGCLHQTMYWFPLIYKNTL